MTGRHAGPVAVVFVNHHSESLLQPLARRYEEAGLTVVVVDNSGTYPAAAPGLRIPAPFNLGFGGACNLAAEALGDSAAVLCLHNPDVAACPDTIHAGASLLIRQARPGIVAPSETVGGLTRRNGYRYPSPAREAALAATFGKRRTAGGHRDVRGRGRRFAGAGLLLVAPDAWRAVDGFDPDYFMYAEDLDLWHRTARAGFDCEFAPQLSFHHEMGTGSSLARADRELWRWLGVEMFAAKHGRSGWRPYRAVHRAWLGKVADPASPLTDAVTAVWRRNLDPVATVEAVRPALPPNGSGRAAA